MHLVVKATAVKCTPEVLDIKHALIDLLTAILEMVH